MHSSLIGKIEKAKRYAQEHDRVRFLSLAVDFRGENDTHRVALADGKWQCACEFFAGWGLCSHTMALERMLAPMLPPEVRDQSLQHATSTT
ncbi:MAG: hypothetical protein HYU88_09085 [Chloroflexi bacterium]|nr:hypothetical protein [Chloroflexota bacterium]MBI4507520.1 hypothetical protein [Chloroflexota bacterium]